MLMYRRLRRLPRQRPVHLSQDNFNRRNTRALASRERHRLLEESIKSVPGLTFPTSFDQNSRYMTASWQRHDDCWRIRNSIGG
jgi:hypothetical protein